jgi:uncharacterized membrane protein
VTALTIAIAGTVMLLTHLGISGAGLRDRLVAGLGEGTYQVFYSLLTLVTMGSLVWLYVEAPRTSYFWYPSYEINYLPKVLLWPAAILLLGGFMVRNPTMVGQGALVRDPEQRAAAATGVNRITRHPFQWAVILWAASHLVANGDQASVPFFGSFLLLSLLGTVSLDAKKSRQLGEPWQDYATLTSNVPFAAIVRGDNQLRLKELLLPALAGTALYLAMYFGHEWLGGIELY